MLQFSSCEIVPVPHNKRDLLTVLKFKNFLTAIGEMSDGIHGPRQLINHVPEHSVDKVKDVNTIRDIILQYWDQLMVWKTEVGLFQISQMNSLYNGTPKVLIWIRNVENYETYRNTTVKLIKQLEAMASSTKMQPVFRGGELTGDYRTGKDLIEFYRIEEFSNVRDGITKQLGFFRALKLSSCGIYWYDERGHGRSYNAHWYPSNFLGA